jgi:hypothetical protein
MTRRSRRTSSRRGQTRGPARTFLKLEKEYKTRFNLSDREYDAIMEERHIAMSHIPNELRIYKDIQFFEKEL